MNTRRLRSAVLVAALATVGGGACDRDDELPQCGVGLNLTNPRLGGPPKLVSDPMSSPVHELRIVWDPGTVFGADLPRRYFEAVEKVVQPGDGLFVLGVALTGDREITVSVSRLYESLRSGPASFTLAFPDRRDYLDCTHRGMPDRYVLEVLLRLSESGEVWAYFTQRIWAGAI